MFRNILVLIVFTIYLPFLAYSNMDIDGSAIKYLDDRDKKFIQLKTLIKTNKTTWLSLKKKYQSSLIKNIKPLSIYSYQVKENDTVFSIAEAFGLTSDTLISFNTLANSSSLNIGDNILVPSMDGVVIFPSINTSTERIAHIYNVPETVLLYVNSIAKSIIHSKEEVFIPFGKMSDEEKNYFLFQPFSFPLASGKFSSNYGMRFHPVKRRWLFHGGVDIAIPSGTNVYASADGTVAFVGEAGGYGNLIVIKHKYGYTTFYGHLSAFKKKNGDKVKNKELIALSGNTGISTGPHLHFEVRRFNLRENPMEVLTFNHQTTSYESSVPETDQVGNFTD